MRFESQVFLSSIMILSGNNVRGLCSMCKCRTISKTIRLWH